MGQDVEKEATMRIICWMAEASDMILLTMDGSDDVYS